MASRLWLRLAFVLAVALLAFQVAFRPVRFEGFVPTLQSPRIHLNLGLDLKGGSRLVFRALRENVSVEDLQGVKRIIEQRIDQLGVVEPTIEILSRQRRIVVELPGIQDPQRAINLIGKTALLEFVDTGTTQLPPGAKWSEDGKKVTLPSGQSISLPKNVKFTGADLQSAQATISDIEGPVVNFQMKGEAAKRFEEYTRENIGRYLTIVLDNEVISSPVIRSTITGGRGQISGGFQNLQEARDLAVLLRSGALPVPVEVEENRTIGPLLGRDSIERSLKAGYIGTILVILFMLLYYRLQGFLASLALGLYILLILAALTGLNATLTLPGIAGIILSIGMAVDANVIIFEKMKEELRLGKTLYMAIQTGWRRALVTIVDSNTTTLIAAVVLLWLGSGPIRGFAVTLTIGVIASMFTAIVVTRVFVDLVSGTRLASWLKAIAATGGRTSEAA
ncbi:MAG: protein translocase subunit SecD [Armatimonadota bacterium]|nr:protein translocase subunit SecD [Armatimonadota bacterium]